MRVKFLSLTTLKELVFDLTKPFDLFKLDMICTKQEILKVCRFAGSYEGQEFWEGDMIRTSDGHMTKPLLWVDGDYGFGAMYVLSRYAAKTGCKLEVIGKGFHEQGIMVL